MTPEQRQIDTATTALRIARRDLMEKGIPAGAVDAAVLAWAEWIKARREAGE